MRAEEALGRFLGSCRARSLSPATLRWYETRLGAFLRGRAQVPLDGAAVEEFLGALSVSDATRHGYFRALRAFYRWGSSRRVVAGDAMVGLRAPRLRRRAPRTLDGPTVRRVMGAALTRRDKALVALLLDTGVRLGEAWGLRWSDVSVEASTIRVDGKTGAREVPVSELVRWLLLGVELPWRSDDGRELTLGGMAEAVRRCLRRAGVARGGPHLLRHTFGRLYILAGGDVFSLQRILGHSSLTTTRIYVEMGVADLVAQHRKFSPVVRLLEEAAG